MASKIKKLIKSFLPPALAELLRDQSGSCRYSGHYDNWLEARKMTSGYDDKKILDKVLQSAIKVEKGEAVFERDGVILEQIEYSWPLLAQLLLVAAKQDGKLNVLDFGGAFGTTYRQNQEYLQQLKAVTWNIVEQPQVVAAGQKNITEKNIRFWSSLDDCLAHEPVDLVIFAASLQYAEFPYDILGKIIARGVENIVFDRVILSASDDFVAIQFVPPCIYEANYPIWIFNGDKLIKYFQGKGYRLLADFDDPINGSIKVDKLTADHRGLVFQRMK